jgi:uncharacterized protein YrrD
MKRSIKSLIGYTMGATDGEIGKVKEFYFDDQSWTIRYLIVETGSWLNGRKVLISPQALLTPDWENKVFPINLTKEKIKNSPFVDSEQPVSRQHEIEMYEYYPWTSYWGGGIWGGGMGVSGMMTQVHEPLIETVRSENSTDTKDADGDPHLRSTHKVTGYSIRAIDGKIGDVEDFIIDDSSWKVAYFVADTGHWFPGKKVLISPKLIKKIEWDTSEVILKVTEEGVKDSPEYEPGIAISDSYVANLKKYYGGIAENIY